MYCAGVTTVCDMGSIGEVEEVWEALEQGYMPTADKGELPIKVFAMVPLTTWYCLSPLRSPYALPHLPLPCSSSCPLQLTLFFRGGIVRLPCSCCWHLKTDAEAVVIFEQQSFQADEGFSS